MAERQSDMERLGYVVNTWGIRTELSPDSPKLVYRVPPGRSGFNSAKWWYYMDRGKTTYREDHEGNLPDKSDACQLGWRTFAEIQSVLESRGIHGPWKRPVGQAFDGLWIPATVDPPPLRRRVGDSGKTAPVKWVEGVPCSYSKWRRIDSQDCMALATETGLCKRHQSLTDRREQERIEREEKTETRRQEAREHSARFQLEVDRLEELKPVLEQLGIHPGVFEAVGRSKGDKVGVRAPSEALQELVRLAAIGYEIEEM